MLVLSRKSNESIMIGANVEIIVLGVEGDNVKLGIRAPKEVDIYRKEIYMAIQAENRAAATSAVSIEDVSKFFKK
ncbi:carbon storage regulator CsrA [Paenibacillus sp. MCAF9]|uniref:carbon storage regulator CsrA n=1 Tax=unclassified Paenibacillus TaxID=185978 RepID=UPI003D2AD559